eukprot:14906-Heterococcus_DN1.PRE.1
MGKKHANKSKAADLPQLLKSAMAGSKAALQEYIAAAVKNGDIAGIKALLAAGADPNLIALSSPLMGASVLGEAACIAALVQGGADVSLAQPDGTTALLLAAVNGNDLAVKMLLRLGAP